MKATVFLAFGCVWAQLQGCLQPAPSPKPCQKPKILAAHRHIFSVNALTQHEHRRQILDRTFPGFNSVNKKNGANFHSRRSPVPPLVLKTYFLAFLAGPVGTVAMVCKIRLEIL